MLYSTLPGIVLGFHGCDRSIGESVLAGKTQLRESRNKYDWLGNGIYFWENNPDRALQYADEGRRGLRGSSSNIKEPFVIGAAIDLGCCLNLLDSAALAEVRDAYHFFRASAEAGGFKLPKNEQPTEGPDSLRRNLDCAVVQTVHAIREAKKDPDYDSVRGVFWEGETLYPGTTLREKNHIQVCIRNPNCIKGYFRVREADMDYVLP